MLQELEMQDIDSLIIWDPQDGDQAPEERFKVETLEQANWCLRKLAAIKTKTDEINALALAEIERIKVWQEGEIQKLARHKDFFTGLLEAYHRQVIAQDPKAKTISTPYGKMQIRKQQPKWNYDDQALLAWLKSNRPELVRVKEEPDKAALKKVAKPQGEVAVDPETGEIIAGIVIEEQPDKFSVEVE